MRAGVELPGQLEILQTMYILHCSFFSLQIRFLCRNLCMKVLKIRQHGMLVAFLYVPSLVFWCWRDVYEADKFMQRHKTGDSVPVFPCKESTAGQMLNILNSDCIGLFPTFGICKFVVLI